MNSSKFRHNAVCIGCIAYILVCYYGIIYMDMYTSENIHIYDEK